MTLPREIILQIHCRQLPGVRFEGRTAVRLGIQKGQEVVDDVLADADSALFTATLRVAEGAEAEKPNFLGPFAHGTPRDRFLYLCWGERTENGWEGFRRAKLSLKNLGWNRLNEAWEKAEPIIITAAMTDTQGGPLCGSRIVV